MITVRAVLSVTNIDGWTFGDWHALRDTVTEQASIVDCMSAWPAEPASIDVELEADTEWLAARAWDQFIASIESMWTDVLISEPQIDRGDGIGFVFAEKGLNP